MDTNIAFERLFNYYKVSTIRDLAEKLNMSESTVSKWRQRDSLNAIKKKCRELEIYSEIFGDSFNTFTQTGANSTQIKNQTNSGGNILNSSSLNKDTNIDNELLPLFEALSSVANALDKKAQLKIELTKLISDLPKL